MGRVRTFHQQFDRVTRWYDRFAQIDSGKVHDMSTDSYEDEVYSFFLNCYHLKDWIINDPTVSVDKTTVENFINGSQELRLCADICNGLKHMVRNRQRSGKSPEFGKRDFAVQMGGQQQTISVKYTIETNTGSIDAFALATNCYVAWQSFIASI